MLPDFSEEKTVFAFDAPAVPCIGVVANTDDEVCKVAHTYLRAVEASGAVPVLVTPVAPAAFDAVLDRVDALVFTGGGDFTPEMIGMPRIPQLGTLNAVRDRFEFPFFQAALARHLPMLGICRGMQLMNLAMGGTIYQDLPSEFPGPVLQHSQDAPRDKATHEAALLPDTLLKALLKADSVRVNSFHHQAVNEPAPGLRVAAVSPDGVTEAVESSEYFPMIGVQWHPEALVGGPDAGAMPALFGWLRTEALRYRRARLLHAQRLLSVDTHCDTPMFMARSYYDADEFLAPSRVNADLMRAGGVDAAVMAVYLKQGPRTEVGHAAAVAQTADIMQRICGYAAANGMSLVRTPLDAAEAKRHHRPAVFRAVENGYALGTDPGNVARLAAQGIVYLTLCHNGHNNLCDSASTEEAPEHNGLSLFGRSVVAELNRCGVLVDVSHTAASTVRDVLDCSSMPVFASHSSAAALCRHPRNLTDDQLQALAARGGMVNVCLYGPFLNETGNASVRDAVRHLNHIRNLVGVGHVGIGSDFDGGGGICGCRSSRDWFRFYTLLMAEGYSDNEIVQVTGGNFLRLLDIVQRSAETC